jgi:dimethylhistidine N-methyltransferase
MRVITDLMPTDDRARVELCDLHPETGLDLGEVLEGLSAKQKRLPSKYFYDREGSRLFEEICDLPEYYPTRTEISILETHADAIASHLEPDALLIEYGSGSSRKTRILLDSLNDLAGYVPVDISRAALEGAARGLSDEYPGLVLRPVCADYMTLNTLPSLPFAQVGKRVLFFPGSTIGNLHPGEALDLLTTMRSLAGPGSALIIGVDLRKDINVLERAYNDRQGVTAAFNLNMLRHVNEELDADIPLDAFRHHAFFNTSRSRIEMHLVAMRPVLAQVAGHAVRFEEGESIHTENSYKYSMEEFAGLLKAAGFGASVGWTDPRKFFSVFYAEGD